VPATETFTTGTKYVYQQDALYIAEGRHGPLGSASTSWRSAWTGLDHDALPERRQALVGDTAFSVSFTDGPRRRIDYCYMALEHVHDRPSPDDYLMDTSQRIAAA
jgi:hypothetical protein